VTQPFADFSWRHARRIAAERGVDDANETAVAVVLAALLRRAQQGPGSQRALGRARATAGLPAHLTQALLPAPPGAPAESGPADEDPDPLSARPAGGAGPDEPEELTGAVVGFGLFDPFGEDRGEHR
jgi:hypothetical protein